MREKIPIDIGIGDAERKEIADGLSRLLADTFTLYLQTHNFHWNVVGPMFEDLHEMFEKQYNDVWQAVDPIAERIRALGHPVQATSLELGELTAIDEVEGVPSAAEMVERLVDGHQIVVRTARSVVPLAERAGDQASLDLLTDRLRYHEKTAWMLRSILSDDASTEKSARSSPEVEAATPAP